MDKVELTQIIFGHNFVLVVQFISVRFDIKIELKF